jgi:hypothetical protein
MTVPIVNPVNIDYGDTAHLTPIDQDEAPIPIAQCEIIHLPTYLATWVKGVTDFVLTAVAPGSYAGVQIEWSDGVNPAVRSAVFTVTVVPPEPAVTEIGDTSP